MRFLLPSLALFALLFAACGEDDLDFPGASTRTPGPTGTPGATSTPAPGATATPTPD